MAIAGVRRFTDPSEGDSIFNLDRDMSEKEKIMNELRGRVPVKNIRTRSIDIEAAQGR